MSPGPENGGSNGQRLRLVNRLSASRSPYVRGHMNNPVSWQEWDEDALALAKEHNRLLFVSIGYAACHWCHVMESESFESKEVAELLNASFIPIKIDREERPDIDAIYMNYVQATTGSGGWPLNVFVTPDLEPVFGGTYWRGPNSSMTAVGAAVNFVDILKKMRDVWIHQESRCRESAKEITRQLKQFAEEGVHNHQISERRQGDPLEIELLEEAYHHFARKYDAVNGGFSSAPKFPTPSNLAFLLRLGQWPDAVKHVVGEEECAKASAMAINTLRRMARGGIRDQIGYGFARYSVTEDWSLPHFEKMLYDQAQLLNVYLDAFLVARCPEMLGAICDITTYLTSPPMAAPNGGFYSAEDADSQPSHIDPEKHEGAYYVWTLKQFKFVLGDRDGDICARFYGVRSHGNVSPGNDPHDEFINQNVPCLQSTPALLAKELGMAKSDIVDILKNGRRKLREYRERERPRPALDDKIVVAWNGLAISALARTSAVLEDIDAEKAASCRKAAENAAAFIKQELYDARTGRLWRVYREGRGDTSGFADDYAFLIQGLIDLYETTFDDQHLRWADQLQASQITLFHDPVLGAFYTAPSPPSPDILLRLKSGMDAAEPSANNITTSNLFRLAAMLDDDRYATLAKETVAAFESEVEMYPFCYVGLLGGVVMQRLGVRSVVLMGEGVEVDRAVRKLRGEIGVGRTVVWVGGGRGERVRKRNRVVGMMEGKSGVRVCEAGVCREGEEYV